MEDRRLGDRLSDAFMYIIPAISVVFAVVGFSIIFCPYDDDDDCPCTSSLPYLSSLLWLVFQSSCSWLNWFLNLDGNINCDYDDDDCIM